MTHIKQEMFYGDLPPHGNQTIFLKLICVKCIWLNYFTVGHEDFHLPCVIFMQRSIKAMFIMNMSGLPPWDVIMHIKESEDCMDEFIFCR